VATRDLASAERLIARDENSAHAPGNRAGLDFAFFTVERFAACIAPVARAAWAEVMLWVGNTLDKAREIFDAETVDGFLHKLAI
jgi:hypothetical protein